LDRGPFWFYLNRLEGWTRTWSVVPDFWRYVASRGSNRGEYIRYWSHAAIGDIVLVDWDGSANGVKPSHSMVVTKRSGIPGSGNFQIYLTYHNNNRLDNPLGRVTDAGSNPRYWLFHLFESFS
jgi:hypothetical protein